MESKLLGAANMQITEAILVLADLGESCLDQEQSCVT